MSTPNATVWANYGQAFTFGACIKSSVSGNPLTGGLTGLSAFISLDAGNFAALTTTPVEIQTSGWLRVDISAAEATCNMALLEIRSTTTNAIYATIEIKTLNLVPFVGRYDTQTVQRFEQMPMDMHAYIMNLNSDTGAQQIICNPDGSTKVSGVITEGDVSAVRGKLA